MVNISSQQNANQTHNKILLHTQQVSYNKRQTINSMCQRGCRNQGPYIVLVVVGKDIAAMENSLAVPQEIINGVTELIQQFSQIYNKKNSSRCVKHSNWNINIHSSSIHTNKKSKNRTSLVVQQLRIFLPVQETTGVRFLVWDDSTCCGATKPVCHDY